MRMDKGKPFMSVPQEVAPYLEEIDKIPNDAPVFSEATLYPTLGKGDARFVLGVAEEYDHVINALGPEAVRAILGVKPKLCQRLGVGKLITESLEDARDERDLWVEKQNPSQVVIDEAAAHSAWTLLHDQYRLYFEPEKSMDKDQLRLYLTLTEELGEWEQSQKRKADEDRAAMTSRAQERRAERKATKEKMRAAREALVAALKGEGDKDEALRLYKEAYGDASDEG